MTVARSQLVDLQITRYYHCISRCVRRAHLCGAGYEHRKRWIEQRLQLLADQFAISVCGFSVMDNHLHLLVRLDPERARGWTDREVLRRWMAVYPPRRGNREDRRLVGAWIQRQVQDRGKVDQYRRRLQDLGWMMKALKEPLSRLANKEDGCKGTFWEGRYKSIAILDEPALLATCTYIDLNPVAAGVARSPEGSRHTSLRQRIEHARRCGQLEALKQAARGSIAGSRAAGDLEQRHWLCPLEDRPGVGSWREGMLEHFSLGSYLLLVDYTSRLYRRGKARVSPRELRIFERLGTSVEYWGHQLGRLLGTSRLMGRYFGTSRSRLREIAQRRGVQKVHNAIPQANLL